MHACPLTCWSVYLLMYTHACAHIQKVFASHRRHIHCDLGRRWVPHRSRYSNFFVCARECARARERESESESESERTFVEIDVNFKNICLCSRKGYRPSKFQKVRDVMTYRHCQRANSSGLCRCASTAFRCITLWKNTAHTHTAYTHKVHFTINSNLTNQTCKSDLWRWKYVCPPPIRWKRTAARKPKRVQWNIENDDEEGKKKDDKKTGSESMFIFIHTPTHIYIHTYIFVYLHHDRCCIYI